MFYYIGSTMKRGRIQKMGNKIQRYKFVGRTGHPLPESRSCQRTSIAPIVMLRCWIHFGVGVFGLLGVVKVNLTCHLSWLGLHY